MAAQTCREEDGASLAQPVDHPLICTDSEGVDVCGGWSERPPESCFRHLPQDRLADGSPPAVVGASQGATPATAQRSAAHKDLRA